MLPIILINFQKLFHFLFTVKHWRTIKKNKWIVNGNKGNQIECMGKGIQRKDWEKSGEWVEMFRYGFNLLDTNEWVIYRIFSHFNIIND